MDTLTCEQLDQVAILTVNRPHVLNALNRAALNELKQFLIDAAAQQKIQALILTGSGERAFIAGADIQEMYDLHPKELQAFCLLGQEVANMLETAPFLTLAAVNGYALGSGLEMALACDLLYANRTASLGFPEVSLGLIPGFGGTPRIARAVGAHRAKEMLMSGKQFSAEAALSMGLINGIYESREECVTTARNLLKHSFVALMHAKRTLNFNTLPASAALELERNAFAACFETPESQKAMAAFLKEHHKGG